MELRHLRYFVAVAEELHFGRAAERLRIAPPSLTQQIQALEAELGTRLLNRTKRSVELTDPGRRFLDEARKTLHQAQHTELVGKQAGRGELGRIEIGYMTSSACSGILAQLITRYNADHPQVDLQLRRMESPQQLIDLSEGCLDIGFIRTPDRYPMGLTGFEIARQSILIGMLETHRLAASGRLACADLAEEVFIIPSVESEMLFSGYVSAIGMQGGFSPRISRRAPDYMTIITLVSAGFGLAAVPSSFANIHIPGVCYREVDVVHKAQHVLAYRRSDPAPTVKSFIQSVRKTLSEGQVSPMAPSVTLARPPRSTPLPDRPVDLGAAARRTVRRPLTILS